MDKKIAAKAVLVLFAVTLLFFSCDGLSNSEYEIHVTDGYAGIDLTIRGSLPDSSSPGRAESDPVVLSITDTSGTEIGQFTLSDARINIYQIELEQDLDEVDSEEEEDQESEVEYTGPFVTDLLNNTITPSLPYIELLPGTYDEIKLKIARIEGDETDEDGNPLVDSSDALYDNSIVLSGTYTGSTAGGDVTDINLSISFALDEDFELISEDGMVIDEAVVNDIIVAFRLARWFQFDDSETNSDSVEFSSVQTESDGAGGVQITLNDDASGSNADIWEVIRKNIKESADFGEDEDESGELESHEDEDDDSEDDDDF